MMQDRNHPMSSQKLHLSMDSFPCRRLSDSLLSGGKEDLAGESECQLSELRKWAEEVMISRLDQQSQVTSSPKIIKRVISSRSGLLEGQIDDDSGVSFDTMLLPTEHASDLASTSLQLHTSPVPSAEGAMATTELQSPIKLVSNLESKLSSPTRQTKKRNHNMHLSFIPIHPIAMTTGEKTPRAKTNSRRPSSPSWTLSTCESEDDAVTLKTPADELAPHHLKGITVTTASTRNVLARIMDENNDEVAKDASLKGGKAQESRHSVKFSRRRSSLASIDTDLATAIAKRDQIASSSNILADQNAKMSRGHMTLSPSASSSAVSAGLEMGLGLAMATTAIANKLPNSPPFDNSRRFSATRPHSIFLDASEEGNKGLQHVEYQMPMHGTPAPPHHSMTMSAISKGKERSTMTEEVDLERRRTTGGVLYSQRRGDDGMIGRSRHNRTGTHEAIEVGTPRRPGLHRMTSSVSATSARHFEDDQAMVSAMLRYSQGGNTLREEAIHQPQLDDSIASSNVSISSISEAIASGGVGTTPLDTPCHSHKAMLSPDLTSTGNRLSFISLGDSQEDNHGKEAGIRKENRADGHAMKGKIAAANAMITNGALMGMGGGGHFGPGVRSKVNDVLADLIHHVPISGQGETIQLVEYGSLNSRSAQLMQPLISLFTQQQEGTCKEGAGSHLSFHVTHEDASAVDFRHLTLLLDNHPESYLNTHWQDSHSPNLTNRVFNSFAARPFASRIVAPNTFHAGISLMDLHWSHTPLDAGIASSVKAQVELTTFLQSRAQEFKKGGVLLMAYIARSEEMDCFGSKDIWSTLSNTLAPCIQRLVSCSMVKSEVARHLLSLPLHPRSAKQSKEALKIVKDDWKVIWSCGLGEEGSCDGDTTLPSCEAQPLRLPHPAWKAYKSGALSRVPFTEHMIQLFKNLYESHFRNVLRERGKLSKGAVEFVLDSLWDVLFSRIIDQQPSPMKDIEVEVSIVALRRR